MLRVVVYSSIGALLLMVGCAKKKQGITCANPDPATGQCLRDETQVVDPNDTEAALRRALQNQDQLMAEVQRLQGELEVAKQAGDTQKTAATQQALARINAEAARAGLPQPPPPEIDEHKVPAVKLKLQNKKDKMGERVELNFTHNKNISDFVFRYGGQGRSQVFNFRDFTQDRAQLADVEIPVQLSFKFKGADYCAEVKLNYNFEEASKHMHVGEGACGL